MLNHTGSLLLQTMLYLANSEFSSLELDNGTVLQPQTDVTAKCYGEYGCYSINYPWSDILRPVAQFPESPEKVNPKYCLYTRRNADSCELLDHKDPLTMYKSYLVPTHRIYFIAHGFLESGDRPWIKKLTKALLHKGDVNVITVDWGSGSMPPYAQAVANIRLVGRITAHLIQTMRKELGVRVEYCHIIGHSLGGHLAGYVGHALQEQFGVKLGRITGLDPAEPHFSQTAPEVRLDSTDASFVDIIHTDATPFIKGGLGMDEPIGHLDFYPNGGESQPGCDQSMSKLINDEKGSFFKGLRRFLNCDHVRSYEYFIETVNTDPQCSFLAVECESWENYLAGNCFGCDQRDRMCATFGFNSVHSIQKIAATRHSIVPSPTRKEVKLFLITNSKEPFCQAQYKVTVMISNSTQSVEHGGEIGLFEIEIMGALGKTKSIPLFREQYYKPGGTYTGVVADVNVGHLQGAILHWQHRTTFNILTWRFDNVVIYVNRVIVESLHPSERLELCPEGSSVLVSGRSTNLNSCVFSPEPEVKVS
ncbi:unnamed protein product [Bemisia tabaci]|uniref:Lipase domain-containing protein n=1 Tax=Bemisia tabaci TaxID=7038 RepID=A0A9P0EYF9_BEMTA|nr:unnamed protein product [Bemisia tabaci]